MTLLRTFGATAWQGVATALAVVLFGSSTLFACPQCFGAEETSMIDGAKLGIAVKADGTLVSPPLEDLSPFLPRDTLRENLRVPLHPKSEQIQP